MFVILENDKKLVYSEPNNVELKKEQDEIKDIKSIKQFVKIVSPFDEKLELITSTKFGDNIKAFQLYTSEQHVIIVFNISIL